MVGKQPFARRYQEMEVCTASPLQLIVMLYDGAAQSLQEAREQLKRGDIEGRTRSLNRAIAIISELQASLNFESGGQIAMSLESLYSYMKTRIVASNFGQTAEPLDEVIPLLTMLRSAWQEISYGGPAEGQTGLIPESRQGLLKTATIDSASPGSVNISC